MSKVEKNQYEARTAQAAKLGTPRSAARTTAEQVNRLKFLSIVSGIIGFLLFVSLPFLPVKQEQSSFSWPQGDDLTSITSPLMSYSPLELDVTLPLSIATDLNGDEETVLSTVPETATEATLRGLSVRSVNGDLDVVLHNIVPLSLTADELKDLPDDAVLRIHSTEESTHVWIPDAKNADGEPLDQTIESDVRPMLTGIYSEIVNTQDNSTAARDAGLNVSVTVDSRFTSTPTFIKSVAIWLGIAFLLFSLWILYRIDSLSRDGVSYDSAKKGKQAKPTDNIHGSEGIATATPLLPAGWWKPRATDGVVGFVLMVWHFIGANTSDDGFLLTMGRVAEASGYMANYYRWFGVPESPFGAPYYDLLGWMTNISTASIWMRLPALLAGIVTWLVLSRAVMPRLGEAINNRRVAHWTMALLFVAFWMSYNNGTRPEPIVALFGLLAWVFFERAIANQRLLPAAVGTIFATIALGAGPTGLLAVAALLVSLSSLIRIVIARLPMMGAPKGSPRMTTFAAILAQIAPFLPAGTAILIAVFADQTLATVLEAVSVRGEIGPALPWYNEWERYMALLQPTVDGSFTRRFTMLMLVFCFTVVLAARLRHGGVPGAAKGPSGRLILIFIVTLFFMTFTPTKWTHHFGMFAGIGAVIAALAAVAASQIAMESRRNRVMFIGATVAVFAFCLAGPNGWWYVSSFGVPWWDKTIQFKGIEASTVTMIVAVLILLWGAVIGFTAEAREARAETRSELDQVEREEKRRMARFTGVTAAPIAVLTAIVVTFNILSLSKGFVSQWPAYSVGKGNFAALSGNTCNLGADILVETDTNDSFLPVADGSSFADSLKGSDTEGFGPNNIPAEINSSSGTSITASAGISDVNAGTEKADGTSGASSTDGTDESADSGSSNSTAGAIGNGRSSSNDSDGASDAPNSNETASSEDGSSDEQDSKSTAESAAKDKDSTSDLRENTTLGGTRSTRGVNGSYAHLPFDLDPARVPVLGSYTEGTQAPANTTTSWYSLPELSEERPLVVFSAAGRMRYSDMDGVEHYGQDLTVEFGRTGGDEDGYEVLGSYVPLDIGTAPEWRNLRIPREVIPEGAETIRIKAVDHNLTPDQWLAITPPRAPKMEVITDYVGRDTPTLLDWVTGLQFPCLRTYNHYAGVAEVAQFRISPDHISRKFHVGFMDYYAGGAYGLVQMSTTADEVPTYMRNDWQRDWGVLERLSTHVAGDGTVPRPAEVTIDEVTRSGLWTSGHLRITNL